MNLENKRKSLVKELDRLLNVFCNLTKEFKKRKDIVGLEEEFQKAQEELNEFWKAYEEYTSLSPGKF